MQDISSARCRTPGEVYPVRGGRWIWIEQQPPPLLQTSGDPVGLWRQRPMQVQTPDGVVALTGVRNGRFGLIWVRVNRSDQTQTPPPVNNEGQQ